MRIQRRRRIRLFVLGASRCAAPGSTRATLLGFNHPNYTAKRIIMSLTATSSAAALTELFSRTHNLKLLSLNTLT